MYTQLKAWGNSQGLRFSKEVLEEAGFAPDEELNMTVHEGSILLTKAHRHKTLEERVAESGGCLPNYGEYDFGMEPVGREIW